MDFYSLNRRDLQSLCKLNKIPANITNLAMADALASLNSVEGIEQIMNPLSSDTVGSSIELPEKVEAMSPRVPRTSCRTSTRQKVKKTEVESIPATASRITSGGVRRNIVGDVNELVKTPSVASTRKKVPTTATRQNVLTQLNECEEVEKSGATCNRRKVSTASACQNTVKKEATVQGVYSTRRSTRLTAKKSAEQGVLEKEQSEPVKISSFLDEVIVTSNGDLGKPFPEKSTGSDSGSIETSHESSVSSDNKEDNVEEGSVESCDVGGSKERVEDICSAFEKLDVLAGDKNLKAEKPLHMDAKRESEAEKEDCTSEADSIKVNSFEIFEHHEKFEDLNEKSGQVDNLKPNLDSIFLECEDRDSKEKLMVIDEKNDQNEAPNVSDNELNAYVPLKEHLKDRGVQVEDLKHDSDIIFKLCEDEDSEEKMVVDEKNDQNEALYVSLNKQNAYFAPKDYFEEKNIQKNDLKQDSKVISDVCEDGDSEEELLIKDEKVDLSEVLNVSLKEQNAYLAETDGTDVDAIYSNNESPNVPSKIEVSECTGSPNMVGGLIHFKTRSSDVEMTMENIEEDISKYTINVVPVNLDGLHSNMDFEAPKVSLVDETPVYLNSELNQETEETKAGSDKVTHGSVAEVSLIKEIIANDATKHPTLSDIPTPISGITPVLDNSGSKAQAEEDKSVFEKTGDDMSLRQLRKQVKALTLKSTNKDDKVAEARPALQAVCENQLATEELDN